MPSVGTDRTATGRTDLASGFAAEQQEIRALIGSPNQVEAVTARLEKRDPSFGEI